MPDARPVRLQLSRKRGFDLQALSLATNGLPAVRCTRPSEWGNPFNVGGYHKIGTPNAHFSRLTACAPQYADAFYTHVTTSEQAVAMFRRYCELWEKPAKFAPLRGKNLACFCRLDQPCHTSVLLELANTPVCEPA